MDLRKLPIIPTIIVVVAAAVMVALGFWQLGRAEWKQLLIEEYASALASEEKLTAIPRSDHEDRWFLYRKIDVECDPVVEWRSTAARNSAGQLGFAQIAKCQDKTQFQFDGDGSGLFFEVMLGWSPAPDAPSWGGGDVTGRLIAAGDVPKVHASEPLAGLEPLAKPDPNDLPNNHLAYAGQWFFFALTALIIYFLAIRKKLREEA